MGTQVEEYDGPDDYDGCMCGDDDCPECGGRDCSYCGGEGWGMVGVDWDTDDAINGPYDGEIEKCPSCGGSGRAKDMTFW
jgi:hypothetical protein